MSQSIKTIAVCRRQVSGLEDDEVWRDFLERVSGSRSVREMSERQREEVIAELRKRGAKAARPFRKSNKPHVRKVFAIWGDMCRLGIPANPTREGLRAFVSSMTRSDDRPDGVGDPEWLNPDDARLVTEALKGWRAREEKKRDGGRDEK